MTTKLEERSTEILRELVAGLEDTCWSSWQTTYKFMPALDVAIEHLARIGLEELDDKTHK